MRKRHLIILFILMSLAFSCKPGKTEKNETMTNKLAGTWRLIEYTDFDTATGKSMHPYGEHPRGYFTYTKTGIVNLNISAEKPLLISPNSEYKQPLTLGVLLDNAALNNWP